MLSENRVDRWVGAFIHPSRWPTGASLAPGGGDTIKGVVYGIIGTALVQRLLVGIGRWIASVPRVLMLGVLTCVLSLIPIGLPLIWVPAALWLFQKGATGAPGLHCRARDTT